MYIEFISSEGIDLPLRQALDLAQGEEILVYENEQLLETSEKGVVEYAIYQKGDDNPIISGELSLPTEKSFDLIQAIKQVLVEEEGVLSEDIEHLLSYIESEMPRKKAKSVKTGAKKNINPKSKLTRNKKMSKEPVNESSDPVNIKVQSTSLTHSKWLKLTVMLVFTAVCILLLVINFTSSAKSIDMLRETNTELKAEVKKLKSLDNLRGKADVFGRYFLPTLFTNKKEKRKIYVSEKISEEIENQSGQLQSVIQESFNESKKGYTITYICTIKNGDESEIKRISIDFTKSENNSFGFEVSKVPSISEF